MKQYLFSIAALCLLNVQLNGQRLNEERLMQLDSASRIQYDQMHKKGKSSLTAGLVMIGTGLFVGFIGAGMGAAQGYECLYVDCPDQSSGEGLATAGGILALAGIPVTLIGVSKLHRAKLMLEKANRTAMQGKSIRIPSNAMQVTLSVPLDR